MAKIKGITVTLIGKIETGKDPFGKPIYEDAEILVDNVLVSPTSSDDIVNQLNLTGKKGSIYACNSRRVIQTWEDQEVRFFGEKWRVFGMVTQGIEELIPLDWNKKVTVERWLIHLN